MDAPVLAPTETSLGLAWNWEYDQDFVRLLDRAVYAAGLSCFLIGQHNLNQTADEVRRGARRFRVFLDRASDNDQRFLEFNRLLQTTGTRFLNVHHHYQRSIDKANIHSELLARGLHLPLTFIVPPLDVEPNYDLRMVELLPKPFVVKPARGSGGFGVIASATRLDDVARARAQFRNQRFLIQQRIEPQLLAGRRAWFRVYFVCGAVISCWWDDVTHRYAMFTAADEALVNAGELQRVARVIAEVSHLDFFSSEVTLDKRGQYVVVDYVNDPCDMRLQSKCFDGVPDAIVQGIIGHIVQYLQKQFVVPTATRS
jgi:predicted SprT family Zn-dependent metalloprotease